MKITNICKLLEDNDKKFFYIETWSCIYHMVKSLYPKIKGARLSNKADDIYFNSKIYYKVKDENK